MSKYMKRLRILEAFERRNAVKPYSSMTLTMIAEAVDQPWWSTLWHLRALMSQGLVSQFIGIKLPHHRFAPVLYRLTLPEERKG